MRIKYLYFFYLKNMSKSKLYLAASLGFIFLVFIRVYMYFNNSFQQENYGDFPIEVVVIVQMVSVLYMIYFYRTFSSELKYGVHNFFTDGYRILIEKMTSLFLVHILFQVILLLFTYAIFTSIYHLVGIEWSPIYGSLFRFLVDHMFSPLIFSSLIGMIIASIFGDKKISIIFILIIWFFAGVINQQVFSSYFSQVGTKDWESLLSIGPGSLYSIYRPYIGFNVNIGLEWRLITWLLLLVSILFLISLKWAIVKKEKRKVRIIVVLLLSFSIVTGQLSINTNTSTYNYADMDKEVEKYREFQSVNTDVNYEIESYHVQLRDSKVSAKLMFRNSNTDKPSFQLYYAFPIDKILVDGIEASYHREGDIVQVESNTKKFKEIEFIYELQHTQLIPYSNNRMVLLANQAWYPKKRENHVYKDDGIDYVKITDNIPITDETYYFYLEAENLLFTNLEGLNNHYEGYSNGISIILGQGNQLEYEGYEITYPSDWTNMLNQSKEIIDRLELNFEELRQIVSMDIETPPSKIVFLQDGLSAFIREDHLVYNTGGITTAITEPEAFSVFDENIIRIIAKPKGPIDIFNEWVNLTSIMIRKEHNLPILFQTPTIEIIGTSLEERVNEIHAAFGGWDTEAKRDFLKQWYFEMDETWTWDDVEALVEERKVQ